MSTPSPPAAKRPKLDAELPATLSSPAREPASSASRNGATNEAAEARNGTRDESSDEEDEEELQPEKEDLSHRDMYLDTVSCCSPFVCAPLRQLMPGLASKPRLRL